MGEISCQWKKQIPRFADSARDDNLGSVVMAWHYFGSGQKEIEGAGDEGLEVLAVDDGVEETVFEEEFGALKSFGEFLADGLLDDAGAGKTDERAGFANVEVAEHGEAGSDAAGGGVGEHGDIRQLFVIEPGERGGNFGELHEADGALHHARAAGTGDGDERLAGFDGEFDSARDFFADHRAHGAADEAKLHGAKNNGPATELAFGGDHRVIHAEFFLGFPEARGVGLGVDELERVGGGHARVVLGPAAVEEHFEALLGVHFEVELALGADEKIPFKVLAKDDGAAGFALDPQAFGAHAALLGRSGLFDRFFVALEPGHRRKLSVFSYEFSVEYRKTRPRWLPGSPLRTATLELVASVVDPPLSQYTLGVRVFHLAHLGDEVGELDELGMGVAAGADDVDALGTVFQSFDDFGGVEHFVADGVVDFVEDDEIVLAAVDGIAAGLPAFLRQLDVGRIGFGTADFDEAAAHGADFEFIVAEHFGSVELAVMPGTLDELDHEDLEALAHGAKGGTESASGLALARPGVNDEQSFFFRHGLLFDEPFQGAAKRLEFAESRVKGQVRVEANP